MKRQVETYLPTDWGKFKVIAYADSPEELNPNLVLIHDEMDVTQAVLVRIHSECLTGEVFHSKKCDCGAQLTHSMEMIEKDKGVFVYLRQEGRNIGLINKLKAYKLQEEGLDTFEANTALGFKFDQRSYADAIEILKDLGIKKVKLITNNPDKIEAVKLSGIELVERVVLEIPTNKYNHDYLKAKKDFMGHLIN